MAENVGIEVGDGVCAQVGSFANSPLDDPGGVSPPKFHAIHLVDVLVDRLSQAMERGREHELVPYDENETALFGDCHKLFRFAAQEHKGFLDQNVFARETLKAIYRQLPEEIQPKLKRS